MVFCLLVLHLCGWTNRLQGMSINQQVVCAPGAWPCHALSLCSDPVPPACLSPSPMWASVGVTMEHWGEQILLSQNWASDQDLGAGWGGRKEGSAAVPGTQLCWPLVSCLARLTAGTGRTEWQGCA